MSIGVVILLSFLAMFLMALVGIYIRGYRRIKAREAREAKILKNKEIVGAALGRHEKSDCYQHYVMFYSPGQKTQKKV